MQTNSVPYKAPTQIKDSTGLVRLPGEVPAGLSGATKLRRTKVADAPLTLTVVLNRTDQQGFEAFLRGVQNAQSPSYRRYLRPGEQADHFGPSQPEYVAVLGWLRQNGFTLVEGSANRLTLTVSAARAQAENAFGIRIGDYQVGDKIFYANDREPAVPAKIAPYVQAVIGLSNLGKPSAGKPDKAIKSASTYSPASQFLDTAAASSVPWIGVDGSAQQAFGAEIGDYRIGKIFYANEREPAVPAKIAPYVQAVIGLSSLGKPSASVQQEGIKALCKNPVEQVCQNYYTVCVGLGPFKRTTKSCLELYRENFEQLEKSCVDDPKAFLAANGPPPISPSNPPFSGAVREIDRLPGYSASTYPPASQLLDTAAASSAPWIGVNGSGQKVGLLEFDTFNINDVKDYLALAGFPATDINRLSKVDVNGGAQLGPEEAEVLIDIVAVMSNARGAKVVVYDAPFGGMRTSFQTLFNRMISDGVTVISNSWVYCEDQTSQADAQSIDSVLASAAAAGISVLNSTGDFGSTCVDGSGNTISVPADSPHATAVGGTSLTTGPALTYAGELFWNGVDQTPPTGAGGFGVSRYFSRPAYQNGFTSSATRSVPDVAVNGDPAKGIQICQADAGGCPTGAQYGGTSLSAPLWAAFVALLNQAQGQNIGQLNAFLYPLGNTAAFHSPASMGSDFQHVGLGSPNLNLIHRALARKTAGPVSLTVSQVATEPSLTLPDGTTGTVAVADGASEALVVVRLRDADGHTVSGKTVALTATAGAHATISPASGVSNIANGAVIFSVKDTTPEILTFTATDTTDGIVLQKQVNVAFISRPAAAGGITATPVTVNANGSDKTTITVTLLDAQGKPASDKLINLSQGNGASIISAPTTITDTAGQVRFTAVDFNTETVIYKAVDVSDGNLPVPGSATVNFVNSSGSCARNFGTAAPGYSVTTFASNFPIDCFTTIAPIGLAFDSNGNLFVGDTNNNSIYSFGPQGGIAGPATLLGTIPQSFGGALAGLTFTNDGRLYAGLNIGGNIVEVNPGTGAVIRTVATLPDGPLDLHVDPLSGDLFVSVYGAIYRITNFNNGPGTVTAYVQGGGIDGFTFAPDGTIYLKGGTEGIFRVPGTNAPQPAALTLLAFVVGGPDGIALEPNPANPSKPFLYVNRNDGIITRIDTSALPANAINCNDAGAPCTNIYTGGSRGDFVTVGPSGCLYATQSDRVIRLTKADGTCSLAPTNPAPQIVLTPEIVSPSPAQGTTVNFTAQLLNVANPANIPVTLFVSGANSTARLVRTDANGKATFTYTGISTGTDQPFASAEVGGSTLFSNNAQVTWTPGKNSTFLTLNQSPSSGAPNKPLVLTATLVDVSATPVAGVGGVTLSFSFAGQTCTGTTNSAGTATCSITPSVSDGSYPLVATFGGTSSLLPSSASKTVDLIGVIAQTIVLSQSSYSVTEDCTTLPITVIRTGDTSSAASVDYFTTEVTANQLRDYNAAIGKLQFAPGETAKTLGVLINEDSFVEGNETFTVSLRNPSGATLGTLAAATVTIIDDATEPATNPLDNPQLFVCQQYHDFLGRDPDPAGSAFWTDNITKCSDPLRRPAGQTEAQCTQRQRETTSGAFFLSPEFQYTGYFVYRMYQGAFGRQPKFAEFIPDAQFIGTGIIVSGQLSAARINQNKTDFAQQFVNCTDATRSRCAEFKTIYDGLNNQQYVDKLFLNTGVNVNASVRTALVNGLSGGTETRATVLQKVVDGVTVLAEGNQQFNTSYGLTFYNSEFNRAFVQMEYLGYLRRDPDADGYAHWLGKLNLYGNFLDAEMVLSFILSPEYRARFGQP
jgi:hypothetical protein